MRTPTRRPTVSATRLDGHRAGASRGRLIMWILLAAVLIALPFASSPGKYVFDTRDQLWFHPGTYIVRALQLWRPTPYLGQQQHDGIIVPMAVVVGLLRSIHLSVWAAERLWHGLLLFVAAGGTILLVDGLRERRTVLAPASAGLAYALTPYSFGYGLPFTPVWLPYVLLPILLLVVVRGIARPGLVWPAAFGGVTFLMGGGNGAPQVYVLGTAVALMAWLVFAARAAPLRRAVRFGLWSLAFFVALNAYWLFLLKSPEVFNALKFSEQPVGINIASSASEAVRGLGFWQFYGGDEFGPWLEPVRPFVTNPALVLTGFALPVAAFLSAWLVRWRHRLFFVLLAIVAVFIAMGVFPVGHPSPFGHVLEFLYAHVPGVAGLRTTYKVTAQINLSFAVLAGIGAESLWLWATARRASASLARTLIVAVVGLVIAGNAFPLWAGHLYNPDRGTPELPAYWVQALDHLDHGDPAYRNLFVPSTSWTTYNWGAIKEGVIATDPRVRAIHPLRLPVGLRYGSNLMAAVEAPYLEGASPQGMDELLRYLGVGEVVLQNDLNWGRSHAPRPGDVHVLTQNAGLEPETTFGARGENLSLSDRNDPESQIERSLFPVEVLRVTDPLPSVRAERPSPVVVSGDGFGIAQAARAGLLDDHPPVLYSGSLDPAALQTLLHSSPSFVITDSNRRRVWYFSAPRAPRSYTLPAGQTLQGRPVGYLLFGDRAPTQSLVVYPGVRSITASGYGAVFGTSPQYRPANAFDGDASTWWLVGSGSDPTGAWIQATFPRPRLLGSLSIAQPNVWWLREIQTVSIRFSDGSTVSARLGRGGRRDVVFSPRMTSFVRLTIRSVGSSSALGGSPGAAISDVQIPRLNPLETIRVPNDLFTVAGRVPGGAAALADRPITYLFERARSYYLGGPDEETRIVRRFEVPGAAEFKLGGTVHLNQEAGDLQLDQVLAGPQPVTINSSSRLFGNPVLRSSAALDGNLRTEWVPAGNVGQWLQVRFPRHRIGRLTVFTSIGGARTPILRLRAVFSDGSTAFGDLADAATGRIDLRFSPKVISSVTLLIDKVFTPISESTKSVGIQEVEIPGVKPPHIQPASPAPCSGLEVAVDGRSVPVRPVGTVGDLMAGRELALQTCDGRPLILGQGRHDLIVGGGLQPDTIELHSSGTSATPPPVSLPAVSTRARWASGMDIRVDGAGDPFYLVTGQNFDPGWRASIGGRDLGPPVLLDGYSAGWRVDRAGSYTVTVRYTPQRLYNVALALTAVAVMVTMVVLLPHALRPRRRWRAP